MDESIANSVLLKLVIFVTIVIMLMVLGAVSYSKAYKAKNRIIQNIESAGTYQDAAVKINEDLKTMGYQTDLKGNCGNMNENKTSYVYCVEKVEAKDGGYYYKVTTFMNYNLPLIGDMINPSVKGETKILGKTYNYV